MRHLNDFDFDDFVGRALFTNLNESVPRLEFVNNVVDVDHLLVDSLNDVPVKDIGVYGLLRKSGRNAHQKMDELKVAGDVSLLSADVRTDTMNGYNWGQVLGQVVDVRSPRRRITGKKWTTFVNGTDLVFNRFNNQSFDFSKLFLKSADQYVTGAWNVDNMKADSMQIQSINGRNLSDFVKLHAPETQIITGEVTVQQMNIHGDMSMESSTLNGCNVSRIQGIHNVRHFESITVVNGSLILNTPSDNNPKLAALIDKYFIVI